MISVDRPSATKHEYKGKKFIVGFKWGEPSSQIPLAGRVELEDGSNLDFSPSKVWGNVEEASIDVLKQTQGYIDRNMS